VTACDELLCSSWFPLRGYGHKQKLNESCFINTILVASATYLKMTRDLTSGPLTTTRVFPSTEVTEKTWNGNFDHKSRTMQSHTFIIYIYIYIHPAISYYFTQIADTNRVERYMHDKCMRLYGNLSLKSSCSYRFQLWNVYVYMWAHLHTCLFASSKNTLFSLVTGSNRSGLGQSCT